MKLMYCLECHDVRKLDYPEVTCKCGASKGSNRIGGLHAVIQGKAIPLGFDNYSFRRALEGQTENRWGTDGQGEVFEAFVIPKDCPTVTKLEGPSVVQRAEDDPNIATAYYMDEGESCRMT